MAKGGYSRAAPGEEAAALQARQQQSLARLARQARQLWLPRAVARRPASEMSALEFVRDYVAASQPLVMTGLSQEHWPCLRLWGEDSYLLRAAGDAEVSVNATPDGRADSVDAQGRFVKPCEERMRFNEFWSWLAGKEDKAARSGVPYLSRQNDSLREEFSQLLKDVPDIVPIAADAFGNDPEAVNLWIGDDRSVSSCHKDPYENLYIVVRGEKVFTLMPPAAAPFLHERQCPPATYERSTGGTLEATLDVPPADANMREAWSQLGGGQPVSWIPFDVAESQDVAEFPDFVRFGRKLQVEVCVHPGEMLYLPAMWYHRVAQRGLTVAVNYWHDMQMGHFWIHHEFLRGISGLNMDENDSSSEDDDT